MKVSEAVSMSLADAIRNTVLDNGGSDELGPRIGIQPGTLRNKVNPDQPKNQLTLIEAMKMMAVTGDYRVLHAMCRELGFVVVADEESGMESPQVGLISIIQDLLRGRDSERDIKRGLARVDEADHEEMRHEVYDLQEQLPKVLRQMDKAA